MTEQEVKHDPHIPIRDKSGFPGSNQLVRKFKTWAKKTGWTHIEYDVWQRG